jgi:hypothetical protein
MDSIERLKYRLAFDFLAPSIEGQKKMTPVYQAYIETAKGVLEEIARGLESMAVSSGNLGWWNPDDVERAKEVLALQGYDIPKLSKEQIKEYAGERAKYFRSSIQLFEKLIENPESVYERFPDRVKLLHLCEDFKKAYAENYQVLGKAKEAEEDELFLPAHGRDDGNAD